MPIILTGDQFLVISYVVIQYNLTLDLLSNTMIFLQTTYTSVILNIDIYHIPVILY